MRRIITLVLLLVLCYRAANAQLNAQFAASQLFGCPPLVISFTDQSTGGATSWSWDFDNGNSSVAQNPTVSFAQPGIKNVRDWLYLMGQLPIRNIYKSEFFNRLLPILAPDKNGCVQPCHLVHFTNQTIPGESPVTQYVWDFGDDYSPVWVRLLTPITATYNGTYNVTLVARDSNGCQTSQIIPDYVVIGNGPTANATASPTRSCTAPQLVNFTGSGSSPNGSISYAWYFGNGSTSAQQNPTQVYNNGIYDPVLVVTDAFGCQDSAYTHVEDPEVKTGVFYAASNSGCSGIPLQFIDTSNFANSWSWNFGDGGTSTLQNPTHAYAANGNYTVTLTATYNGCSDTYTQTTQINVTSPVNFTISANDTSNCNAPFTVNFSNTSSGATSYLWNFRQ